MKVMTILSLGFLVVILAFPLRRTIQEYELMKSPEMVTVMVKKLPDCYVRSRFGKFMHIRYNDQTFILRKKCKYTKSLIKGQQITMVHKDGTEIFLFPNENVAAELLIGILLAAFLTFSTGILFWQQRKQK